MRIAPRIEKKEKSRRPAKGAGNRSANVAAGDAALYEALRALRLELAARAKVPPYVICHDRTLVELATVKPTSEAGLHDITGLGAAKIARYGSEMLAVIGASGSAPRDQRLDNRLSSTVNQTLALHFAGLDADEIAQRRGIERSTVLGHLADAIEAGLIDAKSAVGLDAAEIEEIVDAFERCGTLESGKLGPAHATLGGRFDFGTLKCLLAELA